MPVANIVALHTVEAVVERGTPVVVAGIAYIPDSASSCGNHLPSDQNVASTATQIGELIIITTISLLNILS